MWLVCSAAVTPRRKLREKLQFKSENSNNLVLQDGNRKEFSHKENCQFLPPATG